MALWDNVQGKWKLANTTYTDDSGNGNTLIASGSPIAADGHDGSVDTATDFERSSSQRLNITDAAQTGLDITGNFSVSAWVRLESNEAGEYHTIINKDSDNGSQRGYHFAINPDATFKLWLSDNGTSLKTANSTTTLNINTWYHLIGVYDGTDIRVYVNNGSAEGTVAHTTGIHNNAQPFEIAAWETSMHHFDGRVSDVAIWSKALSSAERTELYNLAEDFSASSSSTSSSSTSSSSTSSSYSSSSSSSSSSSTSSSFSSSFSLAPYSDVIHQYKFDETSWDGTNDEIVDSVGSEHGQRAGSADTVSRAGTSGRAGDFDGSGDYADIDKLDSVSFPSAGSVAFWFKADVWADYDNIFANNFNSGGNNYSFRFERNVGTGGLITASDTGTDIKTLYTATTFSTGTWYFIVITWNTSTNTRRIYINAADTPDAEDTSTSFTLPTIFTNFVVGGSIISPGRDLDGQVDNFTIYDKELSTLQQQMIYDVEISQSSLSLSSSSSSVSPSSSSSFSLSSSSISSSSSSTSSSSSSVSSSSTSSSSTSSSLSSSSSSSTSFSSSSSSSSFSSSSSSSSSLGAGEIVGTVRDRNGNAVDCSTYNTRINVYPKNNTTSPPTATQLITSADGGYTIGGLLASTKYIVVGEFEGTYTPLSDVDIAGAAFVTATS